MACSSQRWSALGARSWRAAGHWQMRPRSHAVPWLAPGGRLGSYTLFCFAFCGDSMSLFSKCQQKDAESCLGKEWLHFSGAANLQRGRSWEAIYRRNHGCSLLQRSGPMAATEKASGWLAVFYTWNPRDKFWAYILEANLLKELPRQLSRTTTTPPKKMRN